jgi:hypothetical protein
MIEEDGTKVILDAGIKLGKTIEFPLLDKETVKGVDGVVLSHAHLDHSGYLPHMYSMGYDGPTFATKPTFELTNVLISDYMRLSNPEQVTKQGLSAMQKKHKMVEYGDEFRVKNLRFRLLSAGHILGSAMVEVASDKSRLLYTGDFNLATSKLLEPATNLGLKADTLITESTYSGKDDIFKPEKATMDLMVNSLNDTITRGGKAIVPSFAVGRAQEILLLLDDYMKSGRLQKVPIYIDGMIGKAMRIHRHNVIYCRDELQKRILMNDDDPFKSTNFNVIKTRGERKNIINSSESCIIVTTSGMLTGGPVINYLQTLAKESNNKLVLVGYQAVGTPGRELFDGKKEIQIEEKKIKIGLEVNTFHISAHADRPHLVNFIKSFKGLKNVYAVHGEKVKSDEFVAYIGNDKKHNAVAPEQGSTYNA